MQVNILLVDDREDNLTALEAILASLDQNLVRATSGEDALKALLERDFAVILLDVMMPGMDGFETAAHIKQRERTKDVPIIFLTGAGIDRHQVFRGYSSRSIDYLSKPFDPWVLRSKVEVFIELYQARQRLHEQAALLSSYVGDANESESGEGFASQLIRQVETVNAEVGTLRGQLGEAEPGVRRALRDLDAAVADLRSLVRILHEP
ncbi:response regulator [Spiractinospora alimapuensis]|uniref:response regulator n=1 Tax=Spiractinospora alimapuensis TaxID=2820884 RepID=UPI001F3EE98D|nr:response regulator [Spiractinospora alimapuensis]QVQ50694.1 response regulator [Spiractinospora alimapuensis]